MRSPDAYGRVVLVTHVPAEAATAFERLARADERTISQELRRLVTERLREHERAARGTTTS
jgi:hypothetical protein